MALLRCYSYNKDLSEDILLLFKTLVEGNNSKCDCCYEIIENALDNRINLNKEFNLRAYETTIKKNINLTKSKQSQNRISISSQITSNDSFTIEDCLQDESSFSEFTKVDDLFDYECTLKYLSENYSDFIIFDGIYIFTCLKNALKGIPQATEEIRNLCNKYKSMEQAIRIILENGIEEDLLNTLRR